MRKTFITMVSVLALFGVGYSANIAQPTKDTAVSVGTNNYLTDVYNELNRVNSIAGKVSINDTVSPAYLEDIVQESISINGTKMHLSNDILSPGNSYYYGTNTTGDKGWHSFPVSNFSMLFTSNGTFTVPSGITTVRITASAAGGGGGGGNATLRGGGGGGCGMVMFNTVFTVTPGKNIVLVIGGGGAGGTVNVNGTKGGNTTITSTMTGWRGNISLEGGNPGIAADGAGGGEQGGSSPDVSYLPANSTTATSFTFLKGGQDGTAGGFGGNWNGGAGGSGFFGNGGNGGTGAPSAPTNGTGYGSGGGGASSTDKGGSTATAGRPGFVLIEW